MAYRGVDPAFREPAMRLEKGGVMMSNVELAEAFGVAESTIRYWEGREGKPDLRRERPNGVENSLHWSLDTTFREDDSLLRAGLTPENMALLRKIALNLVRRDTGSKKCLRRRRKIAGWNNDYLERLLFDPDETFPPRPPT